MTNLKGGVGGVVVFFFFQAEDGIRDYDVTGVQTCALPIWVLLINITDIRTSTFFLAAIVFLQVSFSLFYMLI